jgi:hypothetical protein
MNFVTCGACLLIFTDSFTLVFVTSCLLSSIAFSFYRHLCYHQFFQMRSSMQYAQLIITALEILVLLNQFSPSYFIFPSCYIWPFLTWHRSSIWSCCFLIVSFIYITIIMIYINLFIIQYINKNIKKNCYPVNLRD